MIAITYLGDMLVMYVIYVMTAIMSSFVVWIVMDFFFDKLKSFFV